MQKLKIAGIEKESIVDGPGVRYAIFTQGCPHKCKGCHNPETHNSKNGIEISVNKLIEEILQKKKYIDGVTITGGEPFLQAEACLELAKELKKHNIHVMCYTGYIYEELKENGTTAQKSFLKYIDTLVDGPFIKELQTYSTPFKGSTNQRILNF